jgi:hypothetical protein
MPSFYDSAEQKPGRAKRVYRKGGKVKKGAAGKKPPRRNLWGEEAAPKASGGVKTGDQHPLDLDLEWKPYSLLVKEKHESGKKTTKAIPYKKPPRRSVFGKKMAKGGQTVARGSGAASPQPFGRNG